MNLSNMKNYILFLFLFILTIPSFAIQEQKEYYEYNIFSFSNITEKVMTVNVDNGKTIEKLKDENGNKIKFKTPAAALTYLYSLGWEIYVKGESSGSTFQGTGSGSTIYWIMRKPCSKKEFERAVQEGIAK